MPPVEAYAVPLIPLAGRALLCTRWSWLMGDDLPEAAQDRDVQRGFVLSLAGFSFTAVAALIVLDTTVRVQLQLPIWYVLVSFLAFIATLNLHAYKSSRWQNQLAEALHEAGTLSLVLAIVALLFTTSFEAVFQWGATALALGVWASDYLVRLWIDHRFLMEMDRVERET